MPKRDPYANTARGKSTRVSEEEDKANMKSFLTGLSYIIPVGFGLNALRIAYRAAKAGKAATGLVKKANAVAKRTKTKTKKPTSTKTKSTSSTTAVPPKKKASAPTPKTSRQGNIGRTTTKFDTPKGKARVEKLPADVKKKKKSGPSFGKDYDSYMNSYFNRRK